MGCGVFMIDMGDAECSKGVAGSAALFDGDDIIEDAVADKDIDRTALVG